MPRPKPKTPNPKPNPLSPARVVHAGRLARIEHIHARLTAVRPDNTLIVTATTLAAELSRTPSTIFEDLRVMKESFGAPIKFDAVRGTQYYERPAGARPFELRPRVWLDATEALALMVGARRIFPFGPHIEAALEKLLPLIDGSVALDPATLATVCSTPDNPATESDVRHFVILFQAILRRQAVRFVYHKVTLGSAPETRTVHPLHLVLFADSCLLVAHDPACHDRRSFDLARIAAPEITGSTFTAPAGFDLKAYLAGATGPFLGEARHEVRLRFAPGFVSRVRERPWHRPQLLVEFPDGSAETTYRVAHTAIIEQRVLAAGGQVEVLSPPEIRDRIRASAQSLLTSHTATNSVRSARAD